MNGKLVLVAILALHVLSMVESKSPISVPIYKKHSDVHTTTKRVDFDDSLTHLDFGVHPAENLKDREYYSLFQNSELSEDRKRSSDSSSATQTINLYSNSIEYYTEILVGTPAQLFRVQVDTGSSIFAIPSTKCTECSETRASYDLEKSTTGNELSCQSEQCSQQTCTIELEKQDSCSFAISYGDGSRIVGALTTDVVSFPSLVGKIAINNTSEHSGLQVNGMFGTIQKQIAQNRGFQNGLVDGILGLSYGKNGKPCYPNCVTPLFNSFVDDGLIDNIFSLKLFNNDSQATESDFFGRLTIGGIDPSDEGKEIVYTPLIEETYYVVEMDDLLVGETSFKPQEEISRISIIDSGTTYIYFPTNIYESMKTTFKQNYGHLYGLSGNVTLFDYGMCLNDSLTPKEINEMYPNITVDLHGVVLTMQPTDYLRDMYSSGRRYWCMGIQNGGNSSMIILGDTFMRAYSVIFDRENKRIGFIGREGAVRATEEPVESSLPIPLWSIIVIGNACAIIIGIIAAIVSVKIYRRRQGQQTREDLVSIEKVTSASIDGQLSDYDDEDYGTDEESASKFPKIELAPSGATASSQQSDGQPIIIEISSGSNVG